MMLERLNCTVREIRILQQLWVNPRLPAGEHKQWRDVPCEDEPATGPNLNPEGD